MLSKMMQATALATFATFGHVAGADTWTLDAGASHLAFGSIKNDTVGEVHSFERLSGTVGPDGTVQIEIDLPSVQTNIDIRNERMNEHVFKGLATATLNAQIDMAALDALDVGATTLVDVEGVLSLVGTDIDVETEMFVARLSDTKVMVATNDMVFLSAEDAGLTGGIDMLQQLANLSGITRTVPVTLRFVFDSTEENAAVTPAAPVATQTALSGDPAAGKKVFRKCKACHSIDEGKNRVGPSLHGIINATSGGNDGFKYSSAMKEAGLTWDTATLAEFFADPKAVVPGTKMAFPGLKKPEDIENLLAYLASDAS